MVAGTVSSPFWLEAHDSSQKTQKTREAFVLKSEEAEAESKPQVDPPMKRSPSVAQSRASRPVSHQDLHLLTPGVDALRVRGHGSA